MQSSKNTLTRLRKKKKIRSKISGSFQKPRLSVFKSCKHIYVQAIDDENGKTLCSSSTLDEGIREEIKSRKEEGKIWIAGLIGLSLAKKLKEKGIESAVFDRNGYVFHGKVKKLADGIREGGINF